MALHPFSVDFSQAWELFSGNDDGYMSLKQSYVTPDHEIKSLTLATQVVEAEARKQRIANTTGASDEPFYHVRIRSTAPLLGGVDNMRHYYVGDTAQIADVREIKQGDTTVKKTESLTHLVVSLVAKAVAACESGKTVIKNVHSYGMPVNDAKETYTSLDMSQMKGFHEITFLNSRYEDQVVYIHVTDTFPNPEAAQIPLALALDFQQGSLQPTPLAADIQNGNFAIADLGAGTLDIAIYDGSGRIIPRPSHSIQSVTQGNQEVYFGTNHYIDRMIKVTTNYFGAHNPVYMGSRERFIKKVLFPSFAESLTGQALKFYASHQARKNEDITDLIMPILKEYANAVENYLNRIWDNNDEIEKFYLAGGGALFGYYFFQNLHQFTIPGEIANIPYLNSRAYLFAYYGSAVSAV
jgi:plasmid segregation protein ParM